MDKSTLIHKLEQEMEQLDREWFIYDDNISILVNKSTPDDSKWLMGCSGVLVIISIIIYNLFQPLNYLIIILALALLIFCIFNHQRILVYEAKKELYKKKREDIEKQLALLKDS